jgi:hypothetical protein
MPATETGSLASLKMVDTTQKHHPQRMAACWGTAPVFWPLDQNIWPKGLVPDYFFRHKRRYVRLDRFIFDTIVRLFFSSKGHTTPSLFDPPPLKERQSMPRRSRHSGRSSRRRRSRSPRSRSFRSRRSSGRVRRLTSRSPRRYRAAAAGPLQSFKFFFSTIPR